MLRRSFASSSGAITLALAGCACSTASGTRSRRASAASDDDELLVGCIGHLRCEWAQVWVGHGRGGDDRAVAGDEGADAIERGAGTAVTDDDPFGGAGRLQQLVEARGRGA